VLTFHDSFKGVRPTRCLPVGRPWAGDSESAYRIVWGSATSDQVCGASAVFGRRDFLDPSETGCYLMRQHRRRGWGVGVQGEVRWRDAGRRADENRLGSGEPLG